MYPNIDTNICTREISGDIEARALETATDLIFPKKIRACAKELASKAFKYCLRRPSKMAHLDNSREEDFTDDDSTDDDSTDDDFY